jgi:hypothetical protein
MCKSRISDEARRRTARVVAGVVAGTCIGAAALLAGCAAQPASDEREVRVGDNLNLYDMYDNSRDWGPSFLVGPPAHHLGDETRIDDTRLVPRIDSQEGTGAADPSTPPSSSGPSAPLTAKPLPPVP